MNFPCVFIFFGGMRLLSNIFFQNILVLITMAMAPLAIFDSFWDAGIAHRSFFFSHSNKFSSAIQAVPLCINDVSTNQRKKSVLYLTWK